MKLILLLFLVFACQFVAGQNKQLIYNFDDLPQSLMTNPGAEVSFDMHAGLPFFSQIYLSAGSSGVNVHDIFKDDGGTINDRIQAHLSKMSNSDFFTVNQQMEILFLGWRDQKKRYYSAGIYQELDAFVYFPKDLAVLAYEGNRNYIGETFKFSDAAFTAEVLNVFHFGFTNYYSEDFNYGFRAKLYSGVFDARSVDNRGSFRTIHSPAAPNRYRHFVSGIDVLVQTSGWASLRDTENQWKLMRNIAQRAFLNGNLGVGVDLGFTYYLSDQYRITGSIIDLGIINHEKDVENYRYYGNYQTDGIEMLFPESGEQSPNYWDRWEDDLDRHLKDETFYDPYITWRPVKINASVDLGFDEITEPCNCHKPAGRIKYRHHLGFHLFSMKRPRGFVHAATLSFDKKFSNNFRGKITYTADSFSFSNVGLLLSARINHFNFYLAADNLLSYPNLAKAHHASVQFGVQLIINRE